MQQWCGKSAIPNDDGELTPATKDNLYKFAHNLSGDLRVSKLLMWWALLTLTGGYQTRLHARLSNPQGIHPSIAILARCL